MLRRELIQCRSSSNASIETITASIPSISSINRILRGGNGSGTGHELTYSVTSTSPSSVNQNHIVHMQDRNMVQKLPATMNNLPPSFPPHPNQGLQHGQCPNAVSVTVKAGKKKYSSYHIDEILKKDDEDQQIPSIRNQKSQLDSSPSPSSSSTGHELDSQQMYYSYYYQALLAHYGSSNVGSSSASTSQSSHLK